MVNIGQPIHAATFIMRMLKWDITLWCNSKNKDNQTLENMITGLESLGNLQTPLNTVLENLADTIADKVIAKIKAEESNKPKYYTRKELCEILHVTNPTVIEMVKRGEIREKKIGGRILYDAAEIDEAVKENKIFRYKRRKNDRF